MVPYRLLNTEGVKTTDPDMFLGVLLSMESKVQRVSNRLLGKFEALYSKTCLWREGPFTNFGKGVVVSKAASSIVR